MNLIVGDIISFYRGYSEISVKVENRMRDVERYNRESRLMQWEKEELNPFTAMELKIPETPKDTTKHLMLKYSSQEWMEIQLQTYIKDLQDAGVI